MATTAELVTQNFQQFFQDFDPTRKEIMEHQTAVILGDEDPTDGEIDAALAKEAKIDAPTTGVTFPKDGLVLTPFDLACIAAASA